MVGKRAIDGKHIDKADLVCDKDNPDDIGLNKLAILTLEYYIRLESCTYKKETLERKICSDLEYCHMKTYVKGLNDSTEILVLDHLIEGTSSIVGFDFNTSIC